MYLNVDKCDLYYYNPIIAIALQNFKFSLVFPRFKVDTEVCERKSL